MRRASCCLNSCAALADGGVVKACRSELWSIPTSARKDWLYATIAAKLARGNTTFSITCGKEVHLKTCPNAFQSIYGIPKDMYYQGLHAVQNGAKSSPTGLRRRKLAQKSLILIQWLSNYFSLHGDRMPHRSKDEIWMPFKTRWTHVFEEYKTNVTNSTSLGQFCVLRKRYFPHVKVKKVSLQKQFQFHR